MLTIHSHAAHKFSRRRKNGIVTCQVTNKPAAATKLSCARKIIPSATAALGHLVLIRLRIAGTEATGTIFFLTI